MIARTESRMFTIKKNKPITKKKYSYSACNNLLGELNVSKDVLGHSLIKPQILYSNTKKERKGQKYEKDKIQLNPR